MAKTFGYVACALLAISSFVRAYPTIDLILNAHNYAREDKGVGPLVYDATVAVTAQNYANSCPGLVHNSGRGNLGENLSIWTSTSSRGGALDEGLKGPGQWVDEYKFYNCQANTGNGTIGHYTQVMWSNTTKVGCGMTWCDRNSPWGTQYPYYWMYVCNYSPPGNYGGQRAHPVAQCNSKVPCRPTTSCQLKGQTSGTLFDGCKTLTCGSGSTVAAATVATTGPATTTRSATVATTGPATVATTGPATTTRSATVATTGPVTTTRSATVATTGPVTTTRSATVATTGPVTTTRSATAATTGPATTTRSATVATTGPVTTTRSATVATTGPVTTTRSATVATTGPAATTRSSTVATTGPAPICKIGYSQSTSNKKTTVTFTNNGGLAISKLPIVISGTISSTTGLTRVGTSNTYNVNAVPIAVGASVSVSYTFTSTQASWTLGSWGCW